jgi:rhodanese-related sulfurtransferase
MLFATLLFAVGCSSHRESDVNETVVVQNQDKDKTITVNDLMIIRVDELKSRWDKGTLTIIDVRTNREFENGHIPTAQHIPLSVLKKELQSLKADQDQEIYLVCAVGGRSGQAQRFLSANGFTKTINVDGGTNEWATKGYPLEKK